MEKVINDIKVARFFSLEEFECPCCHRVMLHPLLLQKLSLLRDKINLPLLISSGYRCKKENRKVHGVKASYHIFGLAVDVQVPSMDMVDLRLYAINTSFGGIGLYDNFLHLDIRSVPERWDQRS